MKIAGFGCAVIGLLIAFLGVAAIAVAFIPGIVNSSETGTAMAIGGSLCGASFLPLLIGVVLILLGRKKNQFEE